MKIILILIFIGFIPALSWSSQEAQVKEGNKFFKEKKWDESIDHYFNALEQGKYEDVVHYDLGTAFYKKRDYDQSIEHLQKAVSKKNNQLNSAVFYNLGNALFQKGRTQEKDNIDAAIESMKKSLQSYENSLKADSKDKDALYNQKVVEEEIKRLEKKKQEQKQDQKQQSSNNQDQKNQNRDQSKNQSSDNKQKQDQEKNSSNQDQNQEKPKEDQQNSTKENKGNEKDEKNKQQQEQQGVENSQEKLQQKQAEDILKNYERDEAPKGLLNFMKYRKGEGHVSRDW